MKIKLSEEQYKKLMSEIGGYDDPATGMRDEQAMMDRVIESYKSLTNGMNILSDLIPGVIVQDRLREQLKEIRESLVNPLNGFSGLLRDIYGQQDGGHTEDSDIELDEGRKKKRKSRKKKSKKKTKKRDACYRKVKSRYKVWPSAYASGALVKCRKVGASNWGNSKKESVEIEQHNLILERKKKSKKRKLTSKPSSEGNLRDWFKRKGAKGKKGGWVDCNAPDGDGGYKSCGRGGGEKRSKYPACRPTPSACKSKGKGRKWGKKASRNESLIYHLKHNIPLNESVFRYGSDSHFNLINDARNLFKENELQLNPIEKDLVESDMGRFGYYQNELVPLDLPMELNEQAFSWDGKYANEIECENCDWKWDVVSGGDDLYSCHKCGHDNTPKLNEAKYRGKKVSLNKPKRGGSKAYYVYVKNPKTGNVKKVSFGSSGLRAKINNRGAVKSFVARHKCKEKNDKTKAGYWSCRLPRYAKSLGLSGGGGQWW